MLGPRLRSTRATGLLVRLRFSGGEPMSERLLPGLRDRLEEETVGAPAAFSNSDSAMTMAPLGSLPAAAETWEERGLRSPGDRDMTNSATLGLAMHAACAQL